MLVRPHGAEHCARTGRLRIAGDSGIIRTQASNRARSRPRPNSSVITLIEPIRTLSAMSSGFVFHVDELFGRFTKARAGVRFSGDRFPRSKSTGRFRAVVRVRPNRSHRILHLLSDRSDSSSPLHARSARLPLPVAICRDSIQIATSNSLETERSPTPTPRSFPAES